MREMTYCVSDSLCHVTQRVLCEGETSDPAPVISGVPQGTVLGPLLFLVYINDLPDVVTSTPRLFADDCLLYRSISSKQDSQALQQDLNALQVWEQQWGMAFNPDKCEVITVTRKRKPITSYYTIHNTQLKTVSQGKYLGITIDSKLSFNPHIDNICKKANTTRAFISRNTKGCPRHFKSLAYTTFVRPLLEYSPTIWDPYTETNIKKLQSVQRRAARDVMDDWSVPQSDLNDSPSNIIKGSPTSIQE